MVPSSRMVALLTVAIAAITAVTAAVGVYVSWLLAAVVCAVLAAQCATAVATWYRGPTSRLVASARQIASASGDDDSLSGGSLDDIADDLSNVAADARRAIEQMATDRDRFETVLEGMSDGVIGLDRDRRVTLMNERAREIVRLESAPLGRPVLDVIRDPAFVALLSNPPARDADREVELDIHGATVRMQLSRPGNKGHRVAMLEDVTQLRQLETIRRDFVANVSHELRTPMAVILANTETLMDGALDEPKHAHKMLEALSRHAGRASRPISDLLDLSRLEAGRAEMSMEPVPVADATRRAAAAVAGAAADKSTEIVIDVGDDLSVLADSSALDQVLVNLIQNAVTHCPNESRITVSAERSGGKIRISVTDDGPGIAPVHRARVFERFYRVDASHSRASGGTGLGLSIVRHLGQAMGGRVGVAGNEPSGSVFWIELPASS